jgi:hypothetical protein
MSRLPSTTSAPSSFTVSLRLPNLTSVPYTPVLCPTNSIQFSPVFYSRPAKSSLFRDILNSSSCLPLGRSVVMLEPSGVILSYREPMGTVVHSSISFCFLYSPKFLGSRLFGLPPAFNLVSCSAYLTLKMEAIYYSETQMDCTALYPGR